MDGLGVVKRMHGYSRWSRGVVLDSASGLDDVALRRSFPIGIGSMWDSLVHMYEAESGWLVVASGDADHDFAIEPPADMGRLIEAWSVLDGRWDAFLGGLSEADLDRVITRQSRMLGRAIRFTVADVCLHVCTHAVHTLAQCRNMLRGCGVESQPANDQIFYAIEVVGSAGSELDGPVSG